MRPVVSGDIVERLRRAADTSAGGGGEWYQLVHRCREAADEIERLRAVRDTERAQVKDAAAAAFNLSDLFLERDNMLLNEIERLRAEVERKHDYACRMDALAEERLIEITRLRAAGDALAEVADEWPELVEAWQEARRER
jgi:uncharacterized small protein (DUF1192 family)